MTKWKNLLADDPTDWLLEESNPFVRYFTLRWILDRSERDAQVAEARQAIAESQPVQSLLARQRPKGYWGSDARPFQGTRGPLDLLMWLGCPANEAIRKALDYQIAGCLREDGAYGIEMNGRTILLPCHGSGLLRLMLYYGYADDPRGRKLRDWLVSIQQPDGVWPCVSKSKPFPCMWATADALRAWRDLPPNWNTPPIVESRDRAMELLLRSDLCRYGKRKPSPEWFRFGFPLRWTSDVLEVLELIAPYVEPDDPRIQPALDLVLKKQDRRGRWPCEKHPKGGKWMEKYIALEEIGRPSKWVTLHAVRTLKTLYAGKHPAQ